MRLLVLAGGFGTRLRVAIGDVPKALAPVGDVPFLQLQIEHWREQGLRKFTFLLYHQANQIIDFLQSQQFNLLKDCQANWLIEPTPMGTGGAIAHAVKELRLSEDFLMINADTWLSKGISEIMEAVSPAMTVVYLKDVSRYGQVYFDERNIVTAFAEKSLQSDSGWINAGLCRLSVDLFADWDGQSFSLEHKLFSDLIKNRRVNVVPLDCDFIDIGVPDDYARFCQWMLACRKLPYATRPF